MIFFKHLHDVETLIERHSETTFICRVCFCLSSTASRVFLMTENQ